MSELQGTAVPLHLALADKLFRSYFNAFLTSPAFDFHLNYVELGTATGFVNKSNIDEYARRRVNAELALRSTNDKNSIDNNAPTFNWVVQHRYLLFVASEYCRELELCRLLTAPNRAVLVADNDATQSTLLALGGWDQIQAFKLFLEGHSGGACLQFWLDVGRVYQCPHGSQAEMRALNAILARYTRAGAPLTLPSCVRSKLPPQWMALADKAQGGRSTSTHGSGSPRQQQSVSNVTLRTAMVDAQNTALLQLRQYWVPRYVHAVSCIEACSIGTVQQELRAHGSVQCVTQGTGVEDLLMWAGCLPGPVSSFHQSRPSQPPCPTATRVLLPARTLEAHAVHTQCCDPLSALAAAPAVDATCHVTSAHGDNYSHGGRASAVALTSGTYTDVSLDNPLSPAALSLSHAVPPMDAVSPRAGKDVNATAASAAAGRGCEHLEVTPDETVDTMPTNTLLLTDDDDTLRLRHDVEVGSPFGRHLVHRVRAGNTAPVLLHLYLFWCDVDALDHLAYPSATVAAELASQIFCAHVEIDAPYGIDVPEARREQLRGLLSDTATGRVGIYAHESSMALQSLHLELASFLDATHQSFLRSMQHDATFCGRQTEFARLAKAPASVAEEQMARDRALTEFALEIFNALVLELNTTSIYRDICTESVQDIADGLDETLAGDAELHAAVEIALKGDKSEVHHCIAFLKAQTEENPIADFLVWADARAMVAIAKTDNSDAAVLRRCKAIARVHGATHTFDEATATSVLQVQKRVGQRITRHWIPLFLASAEYTERVSRKKHKRKKASGSLDEQDTTLQGLFKPLDGASHDIEAFRKLLTKHANVVRFQKYIQGLHLSESLRRTTICDVNFWIEVQKFKALAHRQHRCAALVYDKAKAMIDMYLQFGTNPPMLRIGVSPDAAASVKLKGRNTSAKGTKSGDPDVSAYLFRQPEEQVFQTIFQHYAGFRVAMMEAEQKPTQPVRHRMTRLTRRARSVEPVDTILTNSASERGDSAGTVRGTTTTLRTPASAQKNVGIRLSHETTKSPTLRRTRSQNTDLSPSFRRWSTQQYAGGQRLQHDPNASLTASSRAPFAVALNFSLSDGLRTVAQHQGGLTMLD